MKTRISLMALALASFFLISSCQSKKPESNKVAELVSGSQESAKIKDEILKIVNSLPSNTETVNLINSTGAAYLAGFTGENLKTETLLTRADKAKAYGAILFDLAYTNTYKQVESFSKLLKIYEGLTIELGFQELISIQKSFKERYEKNKENTDSLNFLVSDMLATTNQFIEKNGSGTDISLVFGSAIAKSLNVISNITLFATNKSQLIKILQDQKEFINSACYILGKTKDDAAVSNFYQALLPINTIYNSTPAFSDKTVEEINKLTNFISQ